MHLLTFPLLFHYLPHYLPLHFPYRRTHSIHQMSPASHTSTLFHSSFNLLDMSLIKPHLHIHTTTHIPHQPSKPKHDITHLILQFFPTSSLTHLHDFIPNLFQSQSKFTFIIPQASTIFHLSNFLLTLIGFKYFLKSIQFFLGCIDFWNHILLQKKCFFCFFGFCSGHPSWSIRHGQSVIVSQVIVIRMVSQSWSPSSVWSSSSAWSVSHGHRHPSSSSWSCHPGQSCPVLHLTSASRRCIAFNVRI